MTALNLNRGNVYWANLDSTKGSEIQKQRPCVLVGATPVSRARHTVVVVPLSTGGQPHPPLTIPVKCAGKNTVAVCDQIRAIDKSRLINHVGMLSVKEMGAIDAGLKQVLAL